MDRITAEQRSENMRRIRCRDTRPEMIVRRAVHSRGYRYRLHDPRLPGKPDMVFPSRRKVIFIHGCFWHRHQGCRNAVMPKTRTAFWQSKLEANRQRDALNLQKLHALGWQSLTLWECELSDLPPVVGRICSFLDA